MVRVVIPTVEVVAPDGTKSFWVAALPHSEAVAAVRTLIPPDHAAELLILRVRHSQKGLSPGEVRKSEPLPVRKSSSGRNRRAEPINGIAKPESPDFPRTLPEYRAYAVGSDGLMGFKKIICRDDDEAVAKARRLAKGYDMEIWNGDRFVIRLVQRPE